MNYLLNKKAKRNSFLKYALLIAALLVLIYFHSGLYRGLAYVSHAIFRPVLVLGNSIGEKFSRAGAYFYSKKSLFLENENLKSRLNEQEAKMANYNSVLDENLKIKEILGRKNAGKSMVLAGILSKPNRSPYDTLIIDIGAEAGLRSGQRVFALGDVPIGRVAEVYAGSAKVVLFSSPGEKTEVNVSGKDTFMQIIGRGGGNFEMILPRDFVLEKGTEAVLPGIVPYLVGTVQEILSDSRDAYQKALLLSPVNVQELKFAEVEK